MADETQQQAYEQIGDVSAYQIGFRHGMENAAQIAESQRITCENSLTANQEVKQTYEFWRGSMVTARVIEDLIRTKAAELKGERNG